MRDFIGRHIEVGDRIVFTAPDDKGSNRLFYSVVLEMEGDVLVVRVVNVDMSNINDLKDDYIVQLTDATKICRL